MSKKEKIGIVGSGLIGRSWSMLFAAQGYDVCLYDTMDGQVSKAKEDILKQMKSLKEKGLLRGTISLEDQFQLIREVKTLKECVTDAKHIQECVPENLELKKKVFKDIDEFAGPTTVLGSSTSCIMLSEFTADLANKANCIVVHPTNPPYYVQMVEVVPSPWTTKDIVTRTQLLLREIGQVPVTLKKEIPGFASNRVQYAILNACWHLVKDEVMTVEDIDTLVSTGLGPRYAWMGPLETAHLNADGFTNYTERYGSTINYISNLREPVPSWTPEDATEISEQLNELFPLDKLQERRAWRDSRLVAMLKLKKQMKEDDEKSKSGTK